MRTYHNQTADDRGSSRGIETSLALGRPPFPRQSDSPFTTSYEKLTATHTFIFSFRFSYHFSLL